MLFDKAVEIYAQCVNEKIAIFPINIEGGIRSRLDAIFEPAMKTFMWGNGGRDDQTDEIMPFAGAEGEVPLSPMSPASLMKQLDWPLPATPTSRKSHFSVETGTYGREVEWKNMSEVPKEFDRKVFDAAEKSIKYLVVTNTWRKMISEMKESPRTSHEIMS